LPLLGSGGPPQVWPFQNKATLMTSGSWSSVAVPTATQPHARAERGASAGARRCGPAGRRPAPGGRRPARR
jgi:hypothetical protein